MKKIITTIFILNLSFLFCDMKIGWVNTQKILTEYEDVNKIYAEVEKEKTRLDREFQNKQTTLDSLIQDYQTKKLLLSEEAVKSMEQLINSLQQELQLIIQNVKDNFIGNRIDHRPLPRRLLTPG